MKRSGLFAVVLATVVLLSLRQDFGAASPNSAETYKQLNLFGEVFERVRAEYVDDVSDNSLVELAINGMLTSLDPHSNYLNTKNFNDMKVQTRGEFGGLGIEVSMENGLVKVVSPIDDTPAARAGLKPGDLITHLDGEPVQGLTLPEAVEKMRGPVNSEIKLTIRREGRDPFDVKLTRATIKIQSVRSHLEGDNIGYIRITTFNEQTDTGLNNAMKNLKQQAGNKLVGVILDLRNNPGGLLDQAVAVSDAFLEKGEIVSTRGRRSEDAQRYNARAGDIAGGLSGSRADQRRLGFGERDRRRRVAGPSPRDPPRHAVVRQGLGPDHHPAGRTRGDAADHRALLHALGTIDPGQGDRSGHRRRGRQDRKNCREGRGQGADTPQI